MTLSLLDQLLSAVTSLSPADRRQTSLAAAILLILERDDPMHQSLLRVSGEAMRRISIEVDWP